MDASHLYSSRVYPPKPPKQASAADSKMNSFDPDTLFAAHPVSYCPTSDLPKGQHHPMQNSRRGVLQTLFLGRTPGKQTVRTLFQTVTRLWDRLTQGWVGRVIVQEFGLNVKRSVGRVVGQFPIIRAVAQ